MWENETKKENAQVYPRVKSPAHAKPREEDGVLFVQSVLCLLAIIFVLLVRTIDADAFVEMRNSYKAMLSNGIPLGGETPIARFVNGGVQALRQSTQSWMDALEEKTLQGSGGFWPVKKHEVPEGVSLDSYSISETLLLPVQGNFTSGFGFRTNPVNGQDEFHAGIDLAAQEGTPVAAALNGQVVQTGYTEARGNYIILHHRGGLQTLYQHLLCSFVRAGETVQTGQILGAVGSTGISSGPHLHFELIVDGLRVDPLPQFPQLSA